MRRIACLDLDAFFVEVALKDHPELRGRPIAVGGSPDGRGVVCSASYEARAFGVKSGMSMWHAMNRCQGLQVIGVPRTVGEFSHRVRERLKVFCPVVDSASIDEFFLDFTGCDRLYATNLEIADRLCRDIALDPALPSTIGFGTNRLIAKIASDMAKPLGILEVLPGYEQAFLAPLPLKRIPGVGPQTEETLTSLGLSRIGEIPSVPVETWRRLLGKSGSALFEHALGHCDTPVIADEGKYHQKQLSRERTLSESAESLDVLLAYVSGLSEEAAYDMRSKGLTCGGVTVKIKYDDFVTQTRARKMNRTNRDLEIFSIASVLFRQLYARRARVRLVGVRLEDLQTGGSTESLWQMLEPEARRRLPEIVDAIRDHFGFKAILRARSLTGKHPDSGKPPPAKKTMEPKICK